MVRTSTLAITLWLGAALMLAAANPERGSLLGVKALGGQGGIHNLFALGTNVYSGSSPEGEADFAVLAELGVKTIITVDGAKPDVETARKYGMRYVHLPHGYDGISTDLQLQLAKASTSLEKPVYVHCQHGKHRGPAAAAVICMATEGWSQNQAEAWLLLAGTATNYAGLYQVVRDFVEPTEEQLRLLPAEFPEAAVVSGLVDSMVGIDERWRHLKAVRSAGYGPPEDHPDIDPANEAVILWEYYREAQRLEESAEHGEGLLDELRAAEAEARKAEELLRQYASNPGPALRAELDQTFAAMGQACSTCHKGYRDRPEAGRAGK